MDAMRQSPKLVTVFGGSGFLGRHVVRALAQRGWRIRVAVRRPNLAGFLRPLGVVGQIEFVQANLRYQASVRSAAARADAVVNLVGILSETGAQGFGEVQAQGAALVAAAAAEAGASLVHVSALGADSGSPSDYARSKAAGEEGVLASVPSAVILRPSVLFGQGDGFFNRFAALARSLPAIPLAGAATRFQPIFVGDVAEAVARAIENRVEGGRIYELGGPDIRTLRELVAYVLETTDRRRPIVSIPTGLAKVQAQAVEIATALSLGLLPEAFRLTRDQVALLGSDNVVSDSATAEGRTIEGFGIAPQNFAAIVPTYLRRFRKTGQFDIERATEH